MDTTQNQNQPETSDPKLETDVLDSLMVAATCQSIQEFEQEIS